MLQVYRKDRAVYYTVMRDIGGDSKCYLRPSRRSRRYHRIRLARTAYLAALHGHLDCNIDLRGGPGILFLKQMGARSAQTHRPDTRLRLQFLELLHAQTDAPAPIATHH